MLRNQYGEVRRPRGWNYGKVPREQIEFQGVSGTKYILSYNANLRPPTPSIFKFYIVLLYPRGGSTLLENSYF